MASKLRVLGVLVLAVGMVAAFGGCRGGDTPIDPTFTTTSTGPTTDRTPGGSGGEDLPDIDSTTMWQPDRNLHTVYFDYDSYEIRSDARPMLRSNAEAVSESSGVITVEGHCDERGSEEYNLALGERRANAVKRYLVDLGVPSSKIRTVSFGEDRPAVAGHTESAWRYNRRTDFMVE